ncbi:MAG: prepilin-type N-terminal cleavage/methylation domain-containing protein [Candidatus Taylorbacteria bacterium]|nr:prepilin-type N-terminal cleavage/methylation domain-containing protein [Candidatus Taylorbacteria bacterium]
MNFKFKSGFTVVELLVVLAVAGIIMVVSVGAFSKAPGLEALDKGTAVVLSSLERARNQTLSAKNASVYGVHFETQKVVMFRDSAYSSASTTNVVENLNPSIKISAINLSGGASEVVFERLTGETQKNGTVVISLVSNLALTRTITIFKTGLSQSN